MSAVSTSEPRRPGRFPLSAWIGLMIAGLWACVALLAPYAAPHDPGRILDQGPFALSSSTALLGTDYLGRDVLSRVIFGARFTFGLALLAAVAASATGAALGIAAAVGRRWFDGLMSRTADAFISIPHLTFALIMVAAFGSSLPVLLALLAASYTPGAYRIARASAVNVNATDFVQIARARGEGTPYLIFREILPNIVAPIVTDFGLRFVFAILLMSSLSFLGLGVQPPDADWGALTRENIEGIYTASLSVIVPAAAIGTLTISINMAIDGFFSPAASEVV
jgi:peptide/nickel transport system permease protein